jgi:CheY-like chemotaxis protein
MRSISVKTRRRLALLGPVPLAPIAERRTAREPQRVKRARSPTCWWCIDNEPTIRRDGNVARRLGRRVLKAPDLKSALAAMSEAKVAPNGLLVDYHLDSGNGIEAIAALRWRFGNELPAILITADRSPLVRDEARARDIQVLNKPLKPAALRALIAQWRVARMAAAE